MGYHLKPTREEAAEYERRMAELRVWWVILDDAIDRLYCESTLAYQVIEALDVGVMWAGIGVRHGCGVRPTDREGTVLLTLSISVTTVAVEHRRMRAFVRVLRDNACHGTYREAGTERTYRF